MLPLFSLILINLNIASHLHPPQSWVREKILAATALLQLVASHLPRPLSQLFQSSELIMDIATYRLNQLRANAVKII